MSQLPTSPFPKRGTSGPYIYIYIYIYRVKQFCRGYSCFSTLMYLIRPRLQNVS